MDITQQTVFRIAFLVLLAGIFAMRSYFMLKVHQAGERLMPDKGAVAREGGAGMFILHRGGLPAPDCLPGHVHHRHGWIDGLSFHCQSGCAGTDLS